MPRSSKPKLEIKLGAVDRFSAPLRKLNRSLDRTLAPIRRVKNALRSMRREAAFNALARGARAFGKRIGAVRSALGGLLRRFALITGAGLAAAFALKRIADTGAGIQDVADRLGLAVEQLQGFRFAAEQTGAGANTFDMAFQRFIRRSAEAAAGMGEARIAFRALGIGLRDGQGRMRDSVELFREVADRLSEVENQSIRVALAQKFFDSEGVKLVNTLAEGSAGLDAYMARAKELGLIVGGPNVRALKSLSDTFTDILAVVKAFGLEIGARLAPAVQAITNRFLDWWKVHREGVLKGFEVFLNTELIPTLKWLAEGVKAIGPPVLEFIKKIGGLKTIMTVLLVGVVAPLVIAIGGLVAAFGAIPVAVGAAVAAAAVLIVRFKPVLELFKDIARWTPLGMAFRAASALGLFGDGEPKASDAPAPAATPARVHSSPLAAFAPPAQQSHVTAEMWVRLDKELRSAGVRSSSDDFELNVDNGLTMLPVSG